MHFNSGINIRTSRTRQKSIGCMALFHETLINYFSDFFPVPTWETKGLLMLSFTLRTGRGYDDWVACLTFLTDQTLAGCFTVI